MKIRFGSLVVAAVGKAGGQCIQRNRNNYVLRNITVPTQTLQTRSNPQRSTIAYLSRIWGIMDDSARNSWAVAAPLIPATDSFNDPKVLSPREAFCKCSMPLARFQGEIDSYFWGGRIVNTTQMTFFDINRSTGRVNFFFGERTNESFLEVFALPLSNSSVNPKTYQMRSVGLYLESSPTQEALYQALVAKFGSVAGTQVYALGYRSASADGIWSVMDIQKVSVIT